MECPKDECEFESSERGVKIHYGQRHDGHMTVSKERLVELYWDEGMTQGEIAEELPISQKRIWDLMKEWDIPTRGRSAAHDITPRVQGEGAGDEGYEVIQHQHKGENWHVRHHRLIAVAEYGFDAVKGRVVHHKNNIPWDNRSENLDLMDLREHSLMHEGQGYATG